jgi:hypothetical protein
VQGALELEDAGDTRLCASLHTAASTSAEAVDQGLQLMSLCQHDAAVEQFVQALALPGKGTSTVRSPGMIWNGPNVLNIAWLAKLFYLCFTG